MRIPFLRGLLLVMLTYSCVDRVNIDDRKISSDYPLVIDGSITEDPGPYRVTVTTSFDIESEYSTKKPARVKRMTVRDDTGASEELTELRLGTYEIRNIKGRRGGVYTLKVELLDGRVYESVPDTILPAGKVDTVFSKYETSVDARARPVRNYAISANATGVPGYTRYMWSLTGTFKARTYPEADLGRCNWVEDRCNFAPLCSGWRNIGTNLQPIMVQKFPCECCICWYRVLSPAPYLSDDRFTLTNNYNDVAVGKVPVNGWSFADKMHVDVAMKTLTTGTFNYFKSIRDQQRAVNSLFQPVTGRIPINFVQTAGSPRDLYGIFFAAGIAHNSYYLYRDDVPDKDDLTTLEDYLSRGVGAISCLDLFPNSTTEKPYYWQD